MISLLLAYTGIFLYIQTTQAHASCPETGAGDKWPCNIPRPCFEGRTYGDPEDCEYYFICAPGNLTVRRVPCPQGTRWDKSCGKCQGPDKAICEKGCRDRESVSGPCEGLPLPCTQCDVLLDRGSCGRFWECVNHTWHGRECISGDIYVVDQGKCVSNGTCVLPSCPPGSSRLLCRADTIIVVVGVLVVVLVVVIFIYKKCAPACSDVKLQPKQDSEATGQVKFKKISGVSLHSHSW